MAAFFLSKIKSCVWLAVSGVGIIGTAYQLSSTVSLFNLIGSVWCSQLIVVSIFIAMAAAGTFKMRRSLRWYAWAYIPVLTALGMFLTDGVSFFIGPVCFGEFEFSVPLDTHLITVVATLDAIS